MTKYMFAVIRMNEICWPEMIRVCSYQEAVPIVMEDAANRGLKITKRFGSALTESQDPPGEQFCTSDSYETPNSYIIQTVAY